MTAKETYEEIGQLLVQNHHTEIGQMFGKASLKYKGKAFASFQNNAMIFRLGKDFIAPLKIEFPNSENWDPSGKGRPMKDWLSVPSEYHNSWNSLALQALDFLKST